jgi:hypothetical protein
LLVVVVEIITLVKVLALLAVVLYQMVLVVQV